MVVVNTVQSKKNQNVETWAARVVANGGSLQWNSKFIASNFLNAIKNKSYYAKIVYLLPLLGSGIGAARTPLIDKLNVGSGTNSNFVDADYSQNVGIQGNGSSKRIILPFILSQLGSSNNGGIGYWCLSLGSPGWCIGSHTADLFGIYIDNVTPRVVAYWGNAVNRIDSDPVAPTVSHYYSQRTSANLTLYKAGAQYLQTAGATVIADMNASANYMAIDDTNFTDGKSGLAYFTDGTMTNEEISDFHSVLQKYLMQASGKI